MTHQDFTYVPEPPTPPPARQGQGLRAANDLSRRAAHLCWQISSTEPVANWKARIEAAPEELRECLREFLRQKWRERQDKTKRQAARDSEVAKQAMAEASALVAKL